MTDTTTERERDIEWLRDQKDTLHPLDTGSWSAKNERIDRIIVALSAPPVAGEAIPSRMAASSEGWVLVPREPTKEMQHAASRNARAFDTGIDIYRRMIAAAPCPPVGVGGAPDDDTFARDFALEVALYTPDRDV